MRLTIAKRRSAAGADEAEATSASCDDGDAHITRARTVLLLLPGAEGAHLEELKKALCGVVVSDVSQLPTLGDKTVYLCGNIAAAGGVPLAGAHRVFVVRQLAHGFDESSLPWPVVDVGRVPILVHGVGVFYRRFFDGGEPRFQDVQSEHTFQRLTESTKPGTAHRSGLYLTPVDDRGDEAHFRLLRCSSNLSGPTVGFSATDDAIVGALNREAPFVLSGVATLNHVLAQIYTNTPASGPGQKQTKAKIKAHSDKTKDMPPNGLLAFCTFYDDVRHLSPMGHDPFDRGHKGVSGLTSLVFHLKACAAERPDCRTLPRRFKVPLHPDSVFMVPLSTNRLYTHEIRPSTLGAALLPTRLGYVVRCSSTEAVHRGGCTFLRARNGHELRLGPPTAASMSVLRGLYVEENVGDKRVDYAQHGPFLFSMNQGDYLRPVAQDMGATGPDFRTFDLHTAVGHNRFEDLRDSVRLEKLGKGRQGAVLVMPDASTGAVPIVRTTAKFSNPAHRFGPVHQRLAAHIQSVASLPHRLNNALLEVYANAYATMGFHSDQALDLLDGSCIALYSCYAAPQHADPPPRVLVVESKVPGGGRFEIPLAHDSVVVFSLDTNSRFRHKIVLSTTAPAQENEWLGVTFRTSRTLVHYTGDGEPCFEDGTPLALVSDDGQRRKFYALRRRENVETGGFSWPPLRYTASRSDRLAPVASCGG